MHIFRGGHFFFNYVTWSCETALTSMFSLYLKTLSVLDEGDNFNGNHKSEQNINHV